MTVPSSAPVVSAADAQRIVSALATLGLAQGKAVNLGGSGYVVAGVSAQFDTTRNDVNVSIQFKTGRY